MSDRMRQIPFGRLMEWALSEYERDGAIFGVKKIYRTAGVQEAGVQEAGVQEAGVQEAGVQEAGVQAAGGHETGARAAGSSKCALNIFGEKLELPLGPAAGPHTQLAQNLIAAYAGGGRFFELKTVQVLDGEELPVSKPCILAADECYNVEWSTELYVPQALDEYIKGWFAIKLLCKELGLGDPCGFVFNMSVGYDLPGIKTPKVDGYIESMKNAEQTESWAACKKWALDNLSRFKNVDRAYVGNISPNIAGSITLSTLHGCPPDEIERIASYLITEKKLHTFIKCNPTLLGYQFARDRLDGLGFDYISFDDHHFREDLQFADAVPMLRRLQALADAHSLQFGVKITNTFPVDIAGGELPGEEMYMSGRSLFPLAIEVANRLSKAFDGKLRISYSGGADIHNIDRIYDAGIWPITLATTLLKPGGYQRLGGLSAILSKMEPKSAVNTDKLSVLSDWAGGDRLYQKQAGQPPVRKIRKKVPLLDCFNAPCQSGCPFGQDIPAYLRLAGDGDFDGAFRVITERNPLPFITGTICSHRCMDKCMRNYYEGSVKIRDVKLETAKKAYDAFLGEIKRRDPGARPSQTKVAVVGGGPAGLSAAYFLARAGVPVTVFEKSGSLGGIVRHVIPGFRIEDDAIDRDVELVRTMGAEFRTGIEIAGAEAVDKLRAEGYSHFVICVGAWKPGVLKLDEGSAMGSLEFLKSYKKDPEGLKLGRNVVVIGGGNTAMDTARAALRVPGVSKVSLVYRRTKRYMPADAEELTCAVADGVEFCELLAPVAHRSGTLVCEKMALGAADASGRRSPEPTGEEVTILADTVIAAVGDTVDGGVFDAFGVGQDKRGRVFVNDDTLETNVPRVYAAGDARRGPATVAEAIADAIQCVTAITGKTFDNSAGLNISEDTGRAQWKKGVMYADTPSSASASSVPATAASVPASAASAASAAVPASETESLRCLECATICAACVDVCPNRANILVSAGGRQQVVHVDFMCNECGNCEVFCPYDSAPYRDKFTLFSCDEDFTDSVNQGFLMLDGGALRVRLNGETKDFQTQEELPDGIRDVIGACS